MSPAARSAYTDPDVVLSLICRLARRVDADSQKLLCVAVPGETTTSRQSLIEDDMLGLSPKHLAGSSENRYVVLASRKFFFGPNCSSHQRQPAFKRSAGECQPSLCNLARFELCACDFAVCFSDLARAYLFMDWSSGLTERKTHKSQANSKTLRASASASPIEEGEDLPGAWSLRRGRKHADQHARKPVNAEWTGGDRRSSNTPQAWAPTTGNNMQA